MCVCGNCIDPFVLPNGADGSKGDKGDQGLTGATGATGPAGTDGTNGAIWHNGTSVPTSGLGADGDFYLNTATGDVYKKVSGSWGSVLFNISGTTGAAGADGLSFRHGSGIPISTLGIDGDSYVNLTSPTLDLYKKVSGIWVDTGVDLKGATGADGTDGFNFLQGNGVPSSGLGVDGDSYIDSNTGDLYIKQSGAWTLTGNLNGGNLLDIYGFRAEVGAQTDSASAIAGTESTVAYDFPIETPLPLYDNGNNMHVNRYVHPTASLTQRFILESVDWVTVSSSGGNSSGSIGIFVNGVIASGTNSFQNIVTGAVASTGSFPSVYTDYLTLSPGDEVTVLYTSINGTAAVGLTAGTFSNSF